MQTQTTQCIRSIFLYSPGAAQISPRVEHTKNSKQGMLIHKQKVHAHISPRVELHMVAISSQSFPAPQVSQLLNLLLLLLQLLLQTRNANKDNASAPQSQNKCSNVAMCAFASTLFMLCFRISLFTWHQMKHKTKHDYKLMMFETQIKCHLLHDLVMANVLLF